MYKKKGYSKKSNNSLVNKVKKLEKQVGIMKPEKKRRTTTTFFSRLSSPNLTNSGYEISLVDIPTGANQDQRVGNRIRLSSCRIRGSIYAFDDTYLVGGDAPEVVPTSIRMVIYKPYDPALSLLNHNSTSPVALQPYQLIDIDKFLVVWDKTYDFGIMGRSRLTFDKWVKGQLKNANVIYDNNSSASSVKGLYRIYFVSNRTSSATSPELTVQTRVWYIDV